jgi:hypothetical protein
MTALLRKDALWLLGLGAAGIFIGLVVMVDQAGAALWYRPDPLGGFGPGSLVFHWIAATVLGLCAGLIEETVRTHDYLRHRPVSHARLFWTRQLGGALVVLGWIVLLPGLHLAGTLLFHHDRPLVEPDRFWTYVNQGSVGLAFYGLGVLSAALVRRTLLAVVVAGALSLVMLAAFGLGFYASAKWSLPAASEWVIALGLGLVLTAVAGRLEREGRDLDRPVSRARLLATACSLVLVAAAGAMFLHVIQLDFRRDIVNDYPNIARRPDGKMVLMVEKGYIPSWATDDRHNRIEGSVEGAEVLFQPHPPRERRDEPLASHGRIFKGVRYQVVSCGIPGRCFVGSDGRLHVYRKRLGEDGPAIVQHVGKATGGTFSSRAQPVGYWGRVAVIADRQDGQIWRYDLDGRGPAFEPVPLPGGDRFVEDITWPMSDARLLNNELFGPGMTAVRGERGVYISEKGGFVVAPPPLVAAAARLERQRHRPTATVELRGPVSFDVSVPASDGGPVFTHAYGPYGLADKAIYGEMLALSLLRPPVLSTISLAFPRTPPALGNPTDEDARILLDPLVMLGNHWILVAHLLVTGLLVGLTLRRLGRLGVPGARRAGWAVAVATLGPAAYVVCRACETARAWQPLAAPEAKPALLIRSAA